jgi:hypothetical protein
MVIEIEVGQDPLLGVGPDDLRRGLQAPGLGSYDLIPDLPRFPFDLEPVPAVEAYDLEGRRLRLELVEDLTDGRHVVAVEVDEAELMFLEKAEKRRREVIRVPDLERVSIAFRRLLDEFAEALEKNLLGRHLLLVEVFELEHDRPELRLERGEGVEETAEKVVVEEGGVRLSGEGGVLRRLLGIIMGQGQRVGRLDGEDKIVRDAFRVKAHGGWVGEPQAPREKAPEPLVDLDRIELLGVVAEIIVRSVGFQRFVDEPLPRIVLPGARPEPQEALEFPRNAEIKGHNAASASRLGLGSPAVKRPLKRDCPRRGLSLFN